MAAFLFFVLLQLLQLSSASRILLFPLAQGQTTHLSDMRSVAEMLQQRGHEVHFLINSGDRPYIEKTVRHNERIHDFPPPGEEVSRYNDAAFREQAFTQTEKFDSENVMVLLKTMIKYCENLITEPGLLLKLKALNFDLVIADVADNCGRVVTYYLDVPTVGYSGTGIMLDPSFTPNLPSFIPLPLTGWTIKHMSFPMRVVNAVAVWWFRAFISNYWYAPFDDLKGHYGLNKSLAVEYAYVDKIVFTMIDTSIDYPRPLYPNIINVGGMHNSPAKALPSELNTFINNAEDGVVFVSFGTLITSIPMEKAQEIAYGLSRLPQQVIWAYKGNRPPVVGNNTLIMDWVPQNDILGNPNVKLFISHGGIHSCYEAAYHGKPVVLLPIAYDQHDNADRIANRAQMGVRLDFSTLTADKLVDGVHDVIHTPHYVTNARQTSDYLRDQPLSARDKFLYYVEYAIRHKGQIRLNGESLKDMGTFQYYMVDVVIVVAVICLVMLHLSYYLLLKCTRFLAKRTLVMARFFKRKYD